MKTSSLIDVDAAGTKLYHDWDDETNTGTFRTVQDVSNHLSMNQQAKNNESGNFKGDMHHMASIPLTVWQNWWEEFGGNPMSPENKPRLMQKLNDRDWEKLRVKSGRM